MPQSSRPFSDQSSAGWVPVPAPSPGEASPLSGRLNERVPGDATYVSSQESPEGDSFVLNLSGLAWPQAGPQTLTVRLRRTDTAPVPVLVLLLQAGQTIASRTFWPSQSYADHVMNLTDQEQSRITDYSQLQVRVIAGYSVSVDCCPNKLPEVLTLTASYTNCACLDGSFPLTWDGSTWTLEYNEEALGCGGTGNNQYALDCSGGQWRLQVATTTCTGFSTIEPLTVLSCDPLHLTGSGPNNPYQDCTGCSPGTVTIDVTE